jgi:hypothetical protein
MEQREATSASLSKCRFCEVNYCANKPLCFEIGCSEGIGTGTELSAFPFVNTVVLKVKSCYIFVSLSIGYKWR